MYVCMAFLRLRRLGQNGLACRGPQTETDGHGRGVWYFWLDVEPCTSNAQGDYPLIASPSLGPFGAIERMAGRVWTLDSGLSRATTQFLGLERAAVGICGVAAGSCLISARPALAQIDGVDSA